AALAGHREAGGPALGPAGVENRLVDDDVAAPERGARLGHAEGLADLPQRPARGPQLAGPLLLHHLAPVPHRPMVAGTCDSDGSAAAAEGADVGAARGDRATRRRGSRGASGCGGGGGAWPGSWTRSGGCA